ncbi:MAG: LexA repressor [Candidatus Gottesmanbacteria bacterium GW2011_GWA2_47_9]|uniref:LexA repressor n=2 Tax=Microgenomates group TaxID=1794810 RepID=A0A0G0XVT1_9BACT|nr:MAG: LexA repressor [Candidatus Woesebacteria bacterium GW2011_GWA1_41_13b]KKU88371.1 MAG: LexA repressor [Candidatus Gottesmanbacteria bacterium GW2011_GWA2_47_9]
MNTNAPLSERATRVYDYVRTYQKQFGYTPSIQEIKQNTDIQSLRGVTLQLDKLEKNGLIRRNKGSRRAIQVMKISSVTVEKTISIPLVGQIHAGAANFAQEHIEEYRKVPSSLLRGREDAFLLRIKGTSMNQAGYLPDDIAIVIPTQTANNNDIVIAHANEEETATIKRYKVVYGHSLLIPQSDDPQYQPLPAEEFTIQGKVIGKLQ